MMADTVGLCSNSLPKNFRSATARAESIKAALASFDYTYTTFFLLLRQNKKRRWVLRPDRYPCVSGVA
jgi:hypothetical protein